MRFFKGLYLLEILKIYTPVFFSKLFDSIRLAKLFNKRKNKLDFVSR